MKTSKGNCFDFEWCELFGLSVPLYPLLSSMMATLRAEDPLLHSFSICKVLQLRSWFVYAPTETNYVTDKRCKWLHKLLKALQERNLCLQGTASWFCTVCKMTSFHLFTLYPPSSFSARILEIFPVLHEMTILVDYKLLSLQVGLRRYIFSRYGNLSIQVPWYNTQCDTSLYITDKWCNLTKLRWNHFHS